MITSPLTYLPARAEDTKVNYQKTNNELATSNVATTNIKATTGSVIVIVEHIGSHYVVKMQPITKTLNQDQPLL